MDEAGIERGNIFEYELPFNFTFEGELSANLVAIRLAEAKPRAERFFSFHILRFFGDNRIKQ